MKKISPIVKQDIEIILAESAQALRAFANHG